MPYTKSDYPDSMKNLDKIVRIKAIDILNAMLEEGYEEQQAIPISISQAKEWIKQASDKEKSQLQKKEITDHEQNSDSNSAQLQDSDVKVFYSQERKEWAVKSVGAKQADSYHITKQEAKKRAHEIAGNRDTKVIAEKKEE